MAVREFINMQFVLLGRAGVGKTCLFEKYFTQSFGPTEATISAKVMCKEIVVSHLGNDLQIKLTVWDTAGEEKFRSLMPQYYRGAHGFIIVYDITNRDSFDALNDAIDDAEIFANIEEHVKIISGQRVISRADGLKYAHSKHCLYIEASAKTNEAVDHIFEKLIIEVLSSSIVSKCTNGNNQNLITSQPVKKSIFFC